MGGQLFDMQSSKEHSFLGEEEEAGKLYTSSVDGVTVGLPAHAFLFAKSALFQSSFSE